MKARVLLVIFLGVSCLAIGPIIWNNGNQLADMETRAMIGELLPFEVDSQKPVEIQVGGIHVIMDMSELSKGFNLSRYVYLGFDYPFHIRFEDKKFLISVEIKNANGETIATIVDNQWGVRNDNVIAHDRNYNSYAFEVMDSNLVPVIQVIFNPQNKMYLGGLFYVPNGRMFLFDDTTIVNPSPENITQNRHPIFEYPSEQHLGEMVENSAYQVTRTSTRVIIFGEIVTALGILLTTYTTYTAYVEPVRKELRRRRKRQRQQRVDHVSK